MSEGVHDNSARTFWARRAHYVYDALVAAGAGSVDKTRYQELRARFVREGLSEPFAAQLAFALATLPTPSACEVNPW